MSTEKTQSSPSSEKLSKLDLWKWPRRGGDYFAKIINNLFSHLRDDPKVLLFFTVLIVVGLLLWVVYGKLGNCTDLMLGVIQILGSGGLVTILYLYKVSLEEQKEEQKLLDDDIRAKKSSQIQPQISEESRTTETEMVVFVDAINSDDKSVQEIMESLKKNKFIYLEPVKPSSSSSANFYYKELTVSLELCKAVVLVYNTPTIPINWVHERLRLYKKSLPVARINNIAIFAKNETCQQLLEGKKKSFPIIPQVISRTEEVITFLKDIQSPRTKQ